LDGFLNFNFHKTTQYHALLPKLGKSCGSANNGVKQVQQFFWRVAGAKEWRTVAVSERSDSSFTGKHTPSKNKRKFRKPSKQGHP